MTAVRKPEEKYSGIKAAGGLAIMALLGVAGLVGLYLLIGIVFSMP